MTRLILGLMVAAAGACIGCGAANQQILKHPVRQQVAIVVRVSDEVNEADEAGGVAELVEVVTKELKDHGMDSEVYTHPDDHPPPPRIELNVVYWSETSTASRQLRALGGALSALVGPNNLMVVECAVFLEPNGRRAFFQRFEAGQPLLFGERDEAAAGGEAGAMIMRRLLNPSAGTPAQASSE